jgi:DNA-binding MarR family transcriptional regulator
VPDEEALVVVERELAVLLRRARAFSSQLARQFHPDLEAGAYALLLWLDDVGSARQTEMAAFFGVGKPTLSRQLGLLEQLDLITRTVDDTDRRAQVITLTSGGAAQLAQVRTLRRDRFRTLFGLWTDQDVETFGALLGRLNQMISSASAEEPDEPDEPDEPEEPTEPGELYAPGPQPPDSDPDRPTSR